MLDAVDDGAVLLTEDDVAVLAHNLNDQPFPAEIPQLIQVFQGKFDDALQAGLAHGHDPRAADVFAKQHTKIGRRQRPGLVGLGQIDQGQTGAGGQEKPHIAPGMFDGE